MIFFANLILSLLFWNIFERYYNKVSLSDGVFSTITVYFFLCWIFICGGQYFVGSDYPSYIQLFNGEGLSYYYYKGEILFAFIIELANILQIKGQGLYYIFYSINFLFLFLILKRIDFKYTYIFILLYITFSNLFNNQLNILRQTTAIYIGTYSCLLYLEGKKIKFLIGILASTLIHTSSLIFLLIPFIVKRQHFKIKFYKTILFISIIGSLFIGINTFDFLLSHLPPTYAIYIQKGNIEVYSLSLLITKYIFIPLFWLSISLIKKQKLNGIYLHLYNIGFVGFCLKLFLLKLTIFSRISDTFLIFTIFPLYFYLAYLAKNRNIVFTIILCFLIAFYGLKTLLFPSAEYLYKSIYFN